MLTLPDVGAAATAGEAPYVLDKLLYHATGLSIEEHYTDTGVASDHVFGLMPFFGYRFAPRLRDLKDRRDRKIVVQGPRVSGSLYLGVRLMRTKKTAKAILTAPKWSTEKTEK